MAKDEAKRIRQPIGDGARYEAKHVMKAGTVTVRSKRAALPIDELIRCYELSNRAEGKSERTTEGYTEKLRSFSSFMTANGYSSSLADFTVATFREYVLYLQHKPRFSGHPTITPDSRLLSPRTLQCHVRSGKAFSSWLFAEGYTKENRLKALKLPKAPTKIKEPLTTEEIKAVMGCIDTGCPTGFRDHAMTATLLDTGLRASELASITLGQMNLDAGYVKIMGKGSKERIVPVGQFVRALLWKYISGAREKLLQHECDRLFLSDGGNPFTLNAMKLMFARLAKRSGVKRLHAHLCRHTFAINYLLNGGDVFSLQAILGHSTLEMVRQYLRFTSSQIQTQHHRFSPMDRISGSHAHGTGQVRIDSAASQSSKRSDTRGGRRSTLESARSARWHASANAR